VKIVTGAKASQFKSMCFRNYCKFSCTSGSVYPRAYEGRAQPWDPGNEDDWLPPFCCCSCCLCAWSQRWKIPILNVVYAAAGSSLYLKHLWCVKFERGIDIMSSKDYFEVIEPFPCFGKTKFVQNVQLQIFSKKMWVKNMDDKVWIVPLVL
jgi:hypothetical protein